MEDAHRYVSILKWKAGEQAALLGLANNVKQVIFPLLEVVDAPVRKGRGATKSQGEQLNYAASQMEKCWGTSSPVLVDTRQLRSGEKIDGATPLAYVIEQAHARNVAAIPVVSTLTGANDLRALTGAADNVGVGIRESIRNVIKPAFPAALMRTLHVLGVKAGQVDLVLDAGKVAEDDREFMTLQVEAALRQLPAVSEWRSLTVAAAAFPVNLGGMRPGVNVLPRSDWDLWTSISGVPRQPSFGDYPISHPDLPTLDMSVVTPSASIRYTTPDSTLVLRGRSVRDSRNGGFAQYHTLSQTLTEHPAYAGATFSWGDAFIAQCASGGKSGSLTTWRQVGTNHHLTMVVKQLAKRSGT